MKKSNIINFIIEYESGELSDKNTLELFAELIKSGQAWTLQGHYGRQAKNFVDNGYISTTGKILKSV